MTFLVPDKALYDVASELEKDSIYVNYKQFKCIIFDFESYLLELKINNCAGYLVNDSLGQHEDDFWIVDMPQLTISLCIGLSWTPKKDGLCRIIASEIEKYIREKQLIL